MMVEMIVGMVLMKARYMLVVDLHSGAPVMNGNVQASLNAVLI